MSRMSPQQHVESFFLHESDEAVRKMADALRLLLIHRKIGPILPEKRGRKRAEKKAPPIAAEGAK